MLRRMSAVVLVALLTFTAAKVEAQSFFASIVTDPAAGVDRGSTSGIRKLDEPTGFLTLDTYGAEEIGPSILGFGYVLPEALATGDQLDLAAVVAGPSEDDTPELLAGGLGYRYFLGNGVTGYVNVNYSDITLGSEASLAADIKGELLSASFGLRREVSRGETGKLVTTLEGVGRSARGTVLGFPVTDEDLRLLRVAALYEEGIPFLAQRRFAAAVTKGFDGFGASPAFNPLASAPGVTSDFLRASFSAEFSLPFSKEWVGNAGLIGQWSNDSLPISQRCGYGTNSYARGFDQSFVNGDQCLGSRVELAYNLQFPTVDEGKITFTQAYFGVDVGRVWDNANVLLPASGDSWSSGSLGVRTIQGDFIGEAVFSRIFNEPTGITEQDQSRFWVRAAWRF